MCIDRDIHGNVSHRLGQEVRLCSEVYWAPAGRGTSKITWTGKRRPGLANFLVDLPVLLVCGADARFVDCP
jgi:hypothetical protein